MAERSETEPPEIPTPTDNVCKVCKEEFTSEKCPKLLPCLHTFCGPCLDEQTAAEGDKYKCPECSSKYEKSGIIDDLYALERLNQTAKGEQLDGKEEKTPKCTACEEDEDATSFCTECSEWLCEQCVIAHRRVRVTKDHLIQLKEKVEKKDAVVKPAKQRFMYCQLHHQEPLKLYCETCDKLTCRDCQLLEHHQHRHQFVSEASSQSKQFFDTLVDKMKAKRACIDNAKQLIAKRHDEIVSREKDVTDEINSTVEKVVAEVSNRAKAIITDLNLMCTAKKSQLNARNAEVADLASRIDHSMKFVQGIIEHGSNLSILHTKSLIVNQVRSVIESRCEVPNPNHVVDIRYKHDCDFFSKNLNHLGLLVVDGVPFRPPNMGSTSTDQSNNSVNGAAATQTNDSNNKKRNYLHELQKLSPEQRNAVFLRMMQMQRSQNQQQGNVRSNGPPNRTATGTYPNNSKPPPYSNTNRYPTLSNVQQYNPNGPSNVYSTGLPGSHSSLNGNVSNQSHQQVTLSQLQQQRRNQSQMQNRMPSGRPMPPLIPRPSNNGMPLPSSMYRPGVPTQNQTQTSPANLPVRPEQKGNQNWKWTYVNMPGYNSPSAPGRSKAFTTTTTAHAHYRPFAYHQYAGNGQPGYGHRPGSSSSNPDITRPNSLEPSRTSPSSNAHRPASADSVRVKEEKEGGESYGGLNSCSLGRGDTAVPGLPGVTEDNLAEVLRSLNEDGLPLNLGAPSAESHMTEPPSQPPSRHLPVASKHMDSPDPSEDYCACCHNGGELLCCDFCPKVFHFQCHIPVVTVAPSGSWKCTLCIDKDEVRIEKAESREVIYGSQKRKSPVGLTDKELKACERILLDLFSHEASIPFHEPVSKSVPNYYKIITNPMDFTTIKCKVSRQHFNHYNTIREFMDDISLVFANCSMYNSEQSEVGRAGKTVKDFFGKLVERFLPYYVPFLKDDPPVVSHSLNLPQHVMTQSIALTESTDSESDRPKGSKRRKMENENVIHYQ